MSSQSDPDALRTLYVGAVSVILVFVLIIGLQAVFYGAQESELTRKATASEELAALRAEQLEQINSYRWIDPGRGVVAIPIDRAMELIVSEQGTGAAPQRTRAKDTNR